MSGVDASDTAVDFDVVSMLVLDDDAAADDDDDDDDNVDDNTMHHCSYNYLMHD